MKVFQGNFCITRRVSAFCIYQQRVTALEKSMNEGIYFYIISIVGEYNEVYKMTLEKTYHFVASILNIANQARARVLERTDVQLHLVDLQLVIREMLVLR